MLAVQGVNSWSDDKRVLKSYAKVACVSDGGEWPEWLREYMRMRRRERTEYERDWRRELCDIDECIPVADECDTAAVAMARAMVERATRACTEDERELLYLVYYEGRSVLEVSRILSTPYRTVGYRLNRALRKARHELEIAAPARRVSLPGGYQTTL